jgi:Flp pilus assembly protein TadG
MKTQFDFDGITKSLRRAVNRAATGAEAPAETRSPGRQRGAMLRSGEQGTTIVEFALIMPFMVCIMTAIFTFAIGFYNQLVLTSAVTAGAQYLQSIRTTTSNPCADTLTAIEAAAPNLKGTNIGLTFSINGTPESGSSCAGATTTLEAAQGDPVTVSATYPCFISIMTTPASYGGGSFLSSCQLKAKATVYEY